MNPQSTTALVLSAGFSERMGDFKPLMLLGGITILERAMRLFQTAEVNRIHVVVGHRAPELIPLIDRWGARSIVNPGYPSGMFSSIVAGVDSLEKDIAAFFVLPVDIPLVRPATLRMLMDVPQAGTATICHPTFNQQRGHPPLIGRDYIEAIIGWRAPGGLRAVLESFEQYAVDVPVADEFILEDMDGPQDYRRLSERLAGREILSPAECRALLLDRLKVSQAVWAHGRAVAEQAIHIGKALRAAGCRLNLDLIYAAALVHDMARGKPDHACSAGKLLRDLGLPQMAAIVETHMNLTVSDANAIGEAEVVFLADKLISEDRYVGLDARFLARLNRHRDDSRAQAFIRLRLESARRSAARIEAATGRSLESLRCDDSTLRPFT